MSQLGLDPWKNKPYENLKKKANQPQNLKLRHLLDFDKIENYVSVIGQSVFDFVFVYLCLYLSFPSPPDDDHDDFYYKTFST